MKRQYQGQEIQSGEVEIIRRKFHLCKREKTKQEPVIEERAKELVTKVLWPLAKLSQYPNRKLLIQGL